MMNVYQASSIDEELMDAKFSLWYSDLKEAGIESIWLAESEGEIIGFLSANADGLCVAIESIDPGQGVGTALVQGSGIWRPEQNECPEFWEKMEEKFGW